MRCLFAQSSKSRVFDYANISPKLSVQWRWRTDIGRKWKKFRGERKPEQAVIRRPKAPGNLQIS